MTFMQVFWTWLAIASTMVSLSVGCYFLWLRWRDRRATGRVKAAAYKRWETSIHFARWDLELDGGDYDTALRTQLKREYRRIPDSVNAEVRQ